MDGRRSGLSLPIKCCSFTTKKTWAVRQYFEILQFFKVSTVMIKLLRFSFSENSSPSEVLHLCGKDGHVTVHSAVMSSELIGTAPTDLPYILRVESRQRCWPVQNLYILAPSFPVKQKWVTSLEFVLDEIKKKNINGEDQVTNTFCCSYYVQSNLSLTWFWFSLQKLMGNVLLHLEEGERLDINCTKLLNDEVRIIDFREYC